MYFVWVPNLPIRPAGRPTEGHRPLCRRRDAPGRPRRPLLRRAGVRVAQLRPSPRVRERPVSAFRVGRPAWAGARRGRASQPLALPALAAPWRTHAHAPTTPGVTRSLGRGSEATPEDGGWGRDAQGCTHAGGGGRVDPTQPAGDVLPRERVERLEASAVRARAAFGDRVVWHVNATAHGGGVAEMLQTLLAYGNGAGIENRWLVIDADPEFFAITKRIHNRLHGAEGDEGPLGEHSLGGLPLGITSKRYLILSEATFTGARPEKPKARARAGVRSITRPRTNGPRSLIRTVTLRPLRRWVTRTCVPNASVRCAAGFSPRVRPS